MTERVYHSPLGHPDIADFRNHLRLTTDDLDATLEMSLKAAVLNAEHHIGRYIYPSTVTETIPFANRIVLRGPVLSITSVTVDGTALEAGAFSEAFGVLCLGGSGSVVEVEYEAGMENPPFDIQAAILLHATALFNNPSDSVETLPKASMKLLRPYRTYGVVHGK